jgi:hypothetical protein
MRISTLASFIDQPVITSKLHKAMPALLIGGGVLFGVLDSRGKDKTEKTKSAIVIASTILATLLGTRYLKIKGKPLLECEPLKEVLAERAAAVEKFTRTAAGDLPAKILEKAKRKALSPKEIDFLKDKLPNGKAKKELFETLFHMGECGHSHGTFEKILQLSVLGAVPVVGGIAGGMLADKVTNSPKKTADKFKEGLYQYFANIFLCNVGAGVALFAAEKLVEAKKIPPLNPAAKMAVTLTGIVATGVIGGSAIANFIGKKLINPLFGKSDKKNIYSERKPEALDVALHVDDVATAGVLAGLKWIEPVLPFMYFISGYRAGIGYRNV